MSATALSQIMSMRRPLLLPLTSSAVRHLPSLVQRCGEGDVVAICQLQDWLEPSVRSVARRRQRTEEAANNRVAATFARLWHESAQFDPARTPVLIWMQDIIDQETAAVASPLLGLGGDSNAA